MTGNWLFFYERIISRQEMGIIAVISTVSGILFEIPTGALADLLGKKRVIQIGMFLPVVCYSVALLLQSFWGFLASETLIIISFAFLSGSFEAFAYDSLVERKLTIHFNHVESRRRILQSLAMILAPTIGGYLYTFDIRLPWIFGIVTFLLGSVLFSILATEPTVDTYSFNLSEYRRQLARGARTLFSQKTKAIIIPLFTFSAITFLSLNVVKQATGQYLGFQGDTLGYMFSIVAISQILIGFSFPKIQKKLGIRNGYLVCYALYAIVFLIASLSGGNVLLGGLVLVFLGSLPELTQPLGSIALNSAIPSNVRATTLSTLSMIGQIPYALLFLFFANMTLKENIPVLLLIFSLVVVASLFAYEVRRIIHTKRKVSS